MHQQSPTYGLGHFLAGRVVGNLVEPCAKMATNKELARVDPPTLLVSLALLFSNPLTRTPEPRAVNLSSRPPVRDMFLLCYFSRKSGEDQRCGPRTLRKKTPSGLHLCPLSDLGLCHDLRKQIDYGRIHQRRPQSLLALLLTLR